MTVHNHGSEDGPGLSCREYRVNGQLVGQCQLQSPPAARPGGEGTPDDDLKMVMDACGFPRPAAVSAPASGAPGEEDDGSWMAELLDEIRELLTRYLGEEAMTGTAPMFYPEAIRSAMHKAAFGKLPREMYPAGSLLHRAEEAESRLAAVDRAGVALREDAERIDVMEREHAGVWHRKATGKWECRAGTNFATARDAMNAIREWKP